MSPQWQWDMHACLHEVIKMSDPLYIIRTCMQQTPTPAVTTLQCAYMVTDYTTVIMCSTLSRPQCCDCWMIDDYIAHIHMVPGIHNLGANVEIWL